MDAVSSHSFDSYFETKKKTTFVYLVIALIVILEYNYIYLHVHVYHDVFNDKILRNVMCF